MTAEAAATEGKEEKKVMVAIDESECSHHALKWTLANLRNSLTTPLVAFTVQPYSNFAFITAASLGAYSPELMQSVREHQKKTAVALLEKAKEICAEHGVAAETVAEVGDPKEAICDAVEKLKTNLLILGNHSRGAIKRTPRTRPTTCARSSPTAQPKVAVKIGGKSRRKKGLSKPYSPLHYDWPLLSAGSSEIKQRQRKGNAVLDDDGSCEFSVPSPHSSSPHIVCAVSVAAGLVARGPIQSGMDVETRSQVLQDVHKVLVASASSSHPSAVIDQLASDAEARVLAQFQSILHAPQPPLTDTCMDYIGFDVESSQDADCDKESLYSEPEQLLILRLICYIRHF